jgi:hypothetical protein
MNQKKSLKKVYFKPSRKKNIFCIFTSSNFAWLAQNSPHKPHQIPLHQFIPLTKEPITEIFSKILRIGIAGK